MIGNSLRSDILPALNIGATAIYVPYAVMWQHEVIEDFNHEKMIKINTFEELTKILL
jgi:putative hydrolase of the HAD superfamily